MVAWLGLVTSNPPTPTRNPPCRALRLRAGLAALRAGFALRARAAAHGVGAGACGSHCTLGAIAPTSPPRPKSAGGSASPQGEARRESAAKAERSDCRGREDYGWGWVGGVTKQQQSNELYASRAPLPSTSPRHPRPRPLAHRRRCLRRERDPDLSRQRRLLAGRFAQLPARGNGDTGRVSRDAGGSLGLVSVSQGRLPGCRRKSGLGICIAGASAGERSRMRRIGRLRKPSNEEAIAFSWSRRTSTACT